ncbi:helix-turn-helix domain-containing protein [Mesorhizobium sp.]|uniref:GlxA family transcriptional regulator n=1 Tax=Mesorhizobium sp. TaxID=1871066 RepID=UPI000FE44002|nr:helix-turn-helix domain-containing protein [Mesorhizobium sp.]RWN50283.1 MAG: helix-turn-helix domain-containing protein [Mesorhizobium sp.]RWN70689.1 MAG: helix-turn-helix domain-containing protein [Mesorhizobium sp.]RWN71317.1 MAG: helix-turn-helix domain-containing protein [Mesorhizobium sp.]RWN82296.1 MAG: helix-turn-helix domain-containing protein [Mesorhizobium sp.]RWO06744.1 MAG: helix-turn-helix domain-containing protein [Mesorhizobium sp.]
MKLVTIVIGEGFPLLSLSLITEPLRLANRESLGPVFRWRILSIDGTTPRSSSGHALEIQGGLDEAPTDAVILLASYTPDRMKTDVMLSWLRRRARSGCLMGCVDTGALIFAEAGLLDRRPAAAHHEAIVGFRESRGEAFFADRLFDLDHDRCSSAGGVVTIDMTLALISHFENKRLSRRIAEILNYRPLDSERADGSFGLDWSIPRLDRTLAKAIEMMLANMESPLPIKEIASRLEAKEWKLRRLFLRHVGQSPQTYYVELRLDRARNLLRNSRERVGNIALMCGFPASESLSRAYRKRFKVAPSLDRSLYGQPDKSDEPFA